MNISFRLFKSLLFFGIVGFTSLPFTQATYVQNIETLEYKNLKRAYFEESLDQIKGQLYPDRLDVIQQTCKVRQADIFISYAFQAETSHWIAQTLSRDLRSVGFNVFFAEDNLLPGHSIPHFESDRIKRDLFVIAACTPLYLQRYQEHARGTSNPGVGREVALMDQRLRSNNFKGKIIPIFRQGHFEDCVPRLLHDPSHHGLLALELSDTLYYQNFFKLIHALFLYDRISETPVNAIEDRFIQKNRLLLAGITKGISLEAIKTVIDFNEELTKLLQAHQTQLAHNKVNTIGQDSVIIFGHTGVGKSTLMNLLAGATLIPTASGYTVDAYPNTNNHPKTFNIAHSSHSGTLLPQSRQINGLTYVDLPGLNDTRGPAAQFLNAILIKDILMQASSVRFLFMVNEAAFEVERGASVKALIERLEQLLPKAEQLTQASLLVVSHARKLETQQLTTHIQTKIDAHLYQRLGHMFALNPPYTIVSFAHPDCFTIPSRKQGTVMLNTEACQEDLQFLKSILTKTTDTAETDKFSSITQLTGIKVNQVNHHSLIDAATRALTAQLIQLILTDGIQHIFPILDHCQLTELKAIQANLDQTIPQRFDHYLKAHQLLALLRLHDLKGYDQALTDAHQALHQEVRQFKRHLEHLITLKNQELRHQQAQQALTQVQK